MSDMMKYTIVIEAVNKGQAAFSKAQKDMDSLTKSVKLAVLALKAMAVIAVGSFIKDSVNQFIEFQNEVAKAGAVIRATEEQMKELQEVTKQMSVEFGMAYKDVAEAMYQTFSSGIQDMNEMMVIMKNAGKLAVAENTSMTDSLNVLIGTMNAYGMTVYDTEHIMNVLSKTIDWGNLTMKEYSTELGTIVSAAVAAGQSFEEMSASIAFLTIKGNNAARATTMLRAAYTALIDPVTISKISAYGVAITTMTDVEMENDAILAGYKRRITEVELAMSKLGKELNMQTNYQASLQSSILKANTVLSQQTADLRVLEEGYNSITKRIDEYQGRLDKFSIKSRKNDLEIMEIKRKADKEGRELTSTELARIEELEDKNTDLRIESEKLSIQQSELREKSEYQSKAMEEQSAKMEETTNSINEQTSALSAVSDEVETVTKQYDEMAKSLEEANNQFYEQVVITGKIRPFSEIITELNEKMTQYTQTERLVRLGEIFTNIRALAGISLMADEVDRFNGFVERMNDEMLTQDAVQQKFDIMTQQAAFDVKQLNAEYTNEKIIVGEDLYQAYLRLLDVQVKATQWIIDHKGFVIGLLIVYGLYKLAIIGLTIYQWYLTAAQWGYNTALYACPLTWIIVIIVAFIALIALLTYGLWEGEGAMKYVSIALLALIGPIGWIILLIYALRKHWDDIKETVTGALDAIGYFFNWLGETIEDAFNRIQSVFTDFAKPIVESIMGIYYTITGWFWHLVETAYNWGYDLVQNIKDGINDAKGSLKDTLKDLKDTIKGWVGYDVLKNDMEAMRWGEDLVKYINVGMEDESEDTFGNREMNPVIPLGYGGGGNNSSINYGGNYNITINVNASSVEQGTNVFKIIKEQVKDQSFREGRGGLWYK